MAPGNGTSIAELSFAILAQAATRLNVCGDPSWLRRAVSRPELFAGPGIRPLLVALRPFLHDQPDAADLLASLRLAQKNEEEQLLDRMLQAGAVVSRDTFEAEWVALERPMVCAELRDLAKGVEDADPEVMEFLGWKLDSIRDRLAGSARAGNATRLISLAELEALPPPAWSVNELLPAGGFSVLYGPPGSGKSFLALDLALCIASGLAWKGRAVQPGPVVYAAGEGLAGTWRRVRGWVAGWSTDLCPLARCQDTFRVLPSVPRLLDPPQVAALLALLRALDPPPTLLVLDTLARGLVGGDENSAQDVGRAIEALDRIRREVGCGCLLVHHSGKDTDRGARGSSALLGAADTMLSLTREGEDLSATLRVEKQKDAEPGKPLKLAMSVVDLGPGPDGVPVSTLRVREKTTADLARERDTEVNAVVQVLAQPEFAEKGATRQQVGEILGLSRNPTHILLRMAVAAGKVTIIGQNRSTLYKARRP